MIELTKEQQEAIEKIDQNMLVTAGAGSGKTLVLVRRFVEILDKQKELGVKNVLAVTYTRKAAKEMRTRIKTLLKDLYEKEKNGANSETRNWQQALSEMDSAHIETIHSLCQTILRSFSIHAGVDVHIELLEDIERAQIVEESIEEAMRQAIALGEDDYVFVTYFSPDDVSDILRIVLRNQLQFTEVSAQMKKLSADDLKKELEHLLNRVQKQFLTDLLLDEQWRSALDYVANTPYADVGSQLEAIRKGASSLAETLTASGWQVLLDLAAMNKPGNLGGRSEAAKELRKQINVLIDKAKFFASKLPQPGEVIDEHYWQLWQAFLSIAQRVLAIYKSKKQQLQKLDYDDLIAKTSEILANKDLPVHNHYKNTFSHILVDEFQDTNSVQAGLIKMLAGPKTKLFFIGDDKQSIYKFQGADLATFNALRKEMKDDTAFEHSFRSMPTIVNFVNDIFSRLLHADLAHVDYRAKYRPLKTKRNITDEENELNNVEVIQLPTTTQQANMPSEKIIEGMAIANWIKTKVEQAAPVSDKNNNSRPINYGDFAILLQTNNDFGEIEACLSQFAIPYVTSGGKTFLQRQEIYDLENMLLFLCNASDDHALLGVLRSPMFAISDDLIHQIFSAARVYEPSVAWHSLIKQTERKISGYEPVYEAVSILKRLLADIQILNLSQLVYKIIRDTNYDLAILNLPDGKQRYKNIWKFHALAAKKDDQSAREFVQYLDLSRQLSVDLSNAPVDNGHSVKLMTIHAAKGLEFPAVALPRLSAQGRLGESKLLFHNQYGVAINTARGSFLNQEERDENTPIAYRVSKVLNKDMEIAEKKRLLYVAMTRARDYLGIFIKESDRKGEHAANWLRPLIDQSRMQHTDLQSLLQSVPVDTETGRNEAQRAELNSATKNGAIHEQLLEPLSVISVSESSRELIPRITPKSGALVEPDHSLSGEYFHKLMEYLPQGKTTLPDNELVVLVGQMAEGATHPQIAKAFIEQGKKLLAIFAGSELQSLIANAKTVCHEWNYYMSLTDKHNPKRPDLLLESHDGSWYLIDYKTDHFAIDLLEQQASRHRHQLERYGEDFKALIGKTPQLAIYFAQHGILHKLAFTN